MLARVGTSKGQRTAMNPRRVDGLEINPVEDGFMIYQPDRDRVHYLNHTAVLVLEFSDGSRSASDIAKLVQQAYRLPKPPRKEVEETLGKMTEEGLIQTKPPRTPAKGGPARVARKNKR